MLILLEIPQGVATLATTIYSVSVVAAVAITAFAFRLIYALHGRLSRAEALTEILWDEYQRGTPNMRRVSPPENPMDQERWNQLTDKLSQDQLSAAEAEEFLAALLKRREQADRENDLTTIAILNPGIILTKWQIKEKELRQKKRPFPPWPWPRKEKAAR